MDKDVDVVNPSEVTWALGSRVRPDRDIIIRSHLPGLSIDPSSQLSEEVGKLGELQTTTAKMGIDVKNIFWTLGPFDGVVVFDAPDDETATALMLHLASFGNVRTQTARAYEAAEMEQILGKKTP